MPKPTALKVSEGNRGKRALNAAGEVRPDLLSDLTAPEWLSATAKRVWDRQAPRMSKVRLLTEADAYVFAMFCQEMGNYIDAQIAINKQQREQGESALIIPGKDGKQAQPNPYLIAQSMAAKKAQMLGREFGMTPVGRRLCAVEVQTDMFKDIPNQHEKAASSYYN